MRGKKVTIYLDNGKSFEISSTAYKILKGAVDSKPCKETADALGIKYGTAKGLITLILKKSGFTRMQYLLPRISRLSIILEDTKGNVL